MTEIIALLKRQAEWQRSLRGLPWPEKLRMAAALRASVLRIGSRRPFPASAQRAEHLPRGEGPESARTDLAGEGDDASLLPGPTRSDDKT